MFRSHLLWKLYLGYAVVILFTTVLVGLLTARRTEADALREMEQGLRARSALLRTIARGELRREQAPELQRRVRALGQEIRTRLTVIRADGRVLADSESEPRQMDDHSGRPEVREARAVGLGRSTRYSSTVRQRMMYLALRVEAQGRIRGFVRTSLPVTEVDRRLAALRSHVLLSAALACLAALVLGWVVARRLTRRLGEIARVAEGIAGGDYAQRVEESRRDEIGRLAEAFNRMAVQLQQRHQTILQERNQLVAVLGSMVEGVAAVDREERVVHLNEVAAEVLRVEHPSPLGRPIWEVSRVAEICQALADTIQQATSRSAEVQLVGEAGDRAIELAASPLRDGEQRIVGAVVVLHDVTELRKLEAVRRDFVANVSHELKTPVTAIRGLAETLIDDPAMEPATRQRFLGKLRDQAMRLATLVSDLLSLSRLEDGGTTPEREPLDLRHVVAESVGMLRAEAESRQLALEFEQPDEAITVMGDRLALRQVVDNLLDNALKYTPAGGLVTAKVGGDGQAWIEVTDTGVGIAQPHQERIFERFYRVDKARSRALGGTGLGLSIVKHLVRVHGGEVSLRSAPDQGSTFRIVLPRLLETEAFG